MPTQRINFGRQGFHGIMTDIPPCVDPVGFEDVVNMLFRKKRIVPRPSLQFILNLFQPTGERALNMGSFQDVENFLHTFLLSNVSVYMMTSGFVLHALNSAVYIKTATLNAAGTGYTVNDVLAIEQTGATGGTVIVLEVDGSGAITDLLLDNGGEGYSDATGLTLVGGTGSGATVDIVTAFIPSLGGPTATNLPYAVVKANNRVYFCNGSVPVCFLDGEATFKVAGNVPGSCRFLTANADHMIGAAWTEPDPTQSGATFFPNRVRWSDVGNYDEWNVELDQFTSGLADLIDVPDVITGLSTLGNNSYVYRTNGISPMIPTGQSQSPFYIPNFSTSPKGEGCAFPYSLATYNNVDRFIGNYDVWAFDGTNFTPLMDGKCNGKFFSDLNTATGIGQVRGFITTVLDNGYTYLGYAITIPGANVTWILNIAEGTWTRMTWAPASGATIGYYDLQFVEQVYLS